MATPDAVRIPTDGTALSGSIGLPRDAMYFSFAAEAGTTYQLDTEAGTLMDTVMELRDQDGATTLAENDDDERATGRADSFIEWPCEASGVYFVMVEGFGAATGTFELSITEVTVETPGQEQVGIVGGIVETDGTPYRGEVPAAGDEVLYRFAAERGTAYQLDTEAGTLLDTVMQLKDTDGTTVIMENDDDERATGRADSYIEWECPASGEYYVMVRGFGSPDIGTFTLSVSEVEVSSAMDACVRNPCHRGGGH